MLVTVRTEYLRVSPDSYHSYENVQSLDSIVLVTVSFVNDGEGTWFAILTDAKGKGITQQQGTVPALSITSSRTELEGCLAALKLVNNINSKNSKSNTRLCCDNQAVIHCLKALQNRTPLVSW